MANDLEAMLRQCGSLVIEPTLGADLERLGLVRVVTARLGKTELWIQRLLSPYPSEDVVRSQLQSAIDEMGISKKVVIQFFDPKPEDIDRLGETLSELIRPSALSEGEPKKPIFAEPGRPTRVIGVSSGKGGVGKSSVTVNLAVSLGRLGHRVGVLDADVYGFSIPAMVGVGYPPSLVGKLMIPPRAYGINIMSVGFFIDPDSPVVWRGPMLHKALEQFLTDVFWGNLDYLLIDMPPGTGDVALSLGEFLPRSEIIVVTTPQDAATSVAQRSAFAAKKLKLPVRGVIENMSYFLGEDNKVYEPFGSGGGERIAESLSVSLLGRVPLDIALREGGDKGVPITIANQTSQTSEIFMEIARSLTAMGPPRRYREELKIR